MNVGCMYQYGLGIQTVVVAQVSAGFYLSSKWTQKIGSLALMLILKESPNVTANFQGNNTRKGGPFSIPVHLLYTTS